MTETFFLKTNETRVWRTYTGGAGLERWHGRSGENGSFPEEWAASTTRAKNIGREKIVEGLSRVINLPGEPLLIDVMKAAPEKFFGTAHVKHFGARTGFLVKLIDSAERLGIQVHPDRAFAKKYFHSEYGKTESWIILGDNGAAERSCVYMGFKPQVTRESWREIFDRQDIPAMLDSLHCIPVKPGDCFFVEAGVPHAIGAGCFLAEVQEPTDYTMRTERVTPGGLVLSDQQCHYGVGFEHMLDCFHYEGLTLEETLARWKCEPLPLFDEAAGRVDSLVDERKTKLFSVRRAQVHGTLSFARTGRMSIVIVTQGQCLFHIGRQNISAKQGDIFAVRADCPAYSVEGDATILQSFPPEI